MRPLLAAFFFLPVLLAAAENPRIDREQAFLDLGSTAVVMDLSAHPDDEDVRSLSEGGWANQERMTRLVESIRQTDSVRLAMVEANRHLQRALEALDGFEPSPEREALENLAKFIVDRKV